MDGPDLESSSIPRSDAYATPLLRTPSTPSRRSLTLFTLAAVAAVLFIVLLPVLDVASRAGGGPVEDSPATESVSRGVAQGVSEKATGPLLGGSPAFAWTNAMFLWQRTAYHFQPERNWMNDPNGPMYYKGWYHLFYQYNPDCAVWGNITWGHAVSRDLIHWLYLPLAMEPSHWYDLNGVLTGSATLLPNGRIVMLYTGCTSDSVQVQCLAGPADPSDPLLISWVKSDANPVIFPPPGTGLEDFRDPSTAWYVPADSSWRVAIGSKHKENLTGIVLVYRTTDFVSYELVPGVMHAVAGTGMWECVDFFPVNTESAVGLDTSAESGPVVKHVLKASLADTNYDYYAIGKYSEAEGMWVPDDSETDVGIGLRYDYGKYYASKSFYDPEKQRRVLWGWTAETDSERTDLQKGWASVQTIPRTVVLDQRTGSHLLLWPVEEVEKLRSNSHDFNATEIKAGSVLPVNVDEATQLDIEAVFEVDPSVLAETVEADGVYDCSTSGGAAGRGALGPFGLLVLADEDLSEQTAVYFYIVRGVDGGLKTFFCQDELRSSMANAILKRVYGSTVPVLDGELLTVRVLVDHSIVESFAQGGRTCITSRVYPTVAIYGAARVFLFNNATSASVRAKSLKIWRMSSAFLQPYPLPL